MPPEQPLPLKCYRIYQIMWANNGDTISKQYAGTAALKVTQHHPSPFVFAWYNSGEVWETLAQPVAENVEKSSHQNCVLIHKTTRNLASKQAESISLSISHSCVWSYTLYIGRNFIIVWFLPSLLWHTEFLMTNPWNECTECNGSNCYREISPGLGRGNWQVLWRMAWTPPTATIWTASGMPTDRQWSVWKN